jgi:hypothetical protein
MRSQVVRRKPPNALSTVLRDRSVERTARTAMAIDVHQGHRPLEEASSPPLRAAIYPREKIMQHTKPIHEIRLGTIRAAIWENRSRTSEVWFAVTVSRFYNDGTRWKDSSAFRRDDLPVVAKITEMAYAWIWDRESAAKHASSGQ